ncbi:MaoC family dehydratase [Lachnospiraceae bacterium 62-35]
MIIGLKYCGGCNSRYQRGWAVNRLKEQFPCHEYVTAQDRERCDIWIIVCGCQRACADDGNLKADKKKFLAVGERSFDEIADYIRKAELAEKHHEEKWDSDLDKMGIKGIKRDEGDKERRNASFRKTIFIGDTAFMEKTFYRDDVEAFASLTGDRSRLHLDEEFSRGQWFGRPIIHGVLAASLISTIMGMQLPGEGTIFMEEKVKFLAPVYYGDTVRAEVKMVGAEEKRQCYIGEFEGICKNQRDEVVVKAHCRQMMMKNLFFVKEKKLEEREYE